MAKKNSLKLVPFVPFQINNRIYDESLRPDYRKDDGKTWDAYHASAVDNITFDGRKMLDYTMGSPGEQSTARGYSNSGGTIDWRDNEPFDATIIMRSMERGRSATRFWFEDEANKVYYPFFGDMAIEVLKSSGLPFAQVKDTWIAVKKGANYGIEPYRP